MPASNPYRSTPFIWRFLCLLVLLLNSLWLHGQVAAATLTPIYQIQGSGTASPLYQQWVDTFGVVTGVVGDGFYLQDPLGDGDPTTSDALFVYTRTAPTVRAGQCVQLQRAYVDEFYAKTELSRMKAILPSIHCTTLDPPPAPLPHPRLGIDPIEQFERYEGMVVEVAPLAAAVQGPTKHFANGEVELALLPTTLLPYVEAGRVFQADGAAMHGLLYLTNALGATLPEVHHGEIVQIGENGQIGENERPLAATLAPTTTATITPVRAIIDYNFGKYQLHLWPASVVQPVEASEPPPPPMAAPVAADAFAVCTYNLHAMGRGSEQHWAPAAYDQQLAKRARTIAETLQGCPIIGLQEAGDPTDVERLAALLLRSFALDYIPIALAGPGTASNEYPLTNALLARRDRVAVQASALRQGCSALDYDVILVGDPCVAGQYPLFNRPPLVVDLTVAGPWAAPFPLTVVVNHWKSKGGDEHVNVVRRMAQARHVAALVQEKLSSDPLANVVVLGDLNDYYQSGPIAALRTATVPPLFHTFDLLPALDRYTFIFNGGSQVLDHILVSSNLITKIARVQPIHSNADYPAGAEEQVALLQRSSDHDPIVLQIQPAGVAVVGGNLGFANLMVTLTPKAADYADLTILQARSDETGAVRFWAVPPGEYRLRIDTPAHFNESTQTGILSVEAGYHPLLPVDLMHTTVQQMAALLSVAPALIQQE